MKITPAQLKAYASDPAAFRDDLIIPAARGAARYGDVVHEFQRARYADLDPTLLALCRDEQPLIGRHFWEATKGASKDSDLALCILWLVAFCPRPLMMQVGAADADQADELRKAAKNTLRLNDWLSARAEVSANAISNPHSGTCCDIIPADVAGSHGARPDVLILNELSHVQKREFAENLIDNAAKVPHGLVVIATNAGMVPSWQWDWRELARTSDRWAFHKWDRPAPWLDPAEIEEAERRNSRSRFLRLFKGVWSAGGDAIDSVDVERSVVLSGPLKGKQTGLSFVGGLDLSTKRDHSALCILGADHETHKVKLASIQSWNPIAGKIDLPAIRKAVIDAHQRFKLKALHFDPHQAALMIADAKAAGVPCREMTFSGANLSRMASELLQSFRDGLIELFEDAELIADLGRLCIVEKSYGYKLEAARDDRGHADRATALAIALPHAVELANRPAVPSICKQLTGEDIGNANPVSWVDQDIPWAIPPDPGPRPSSLFSHSDVRG